MKRLLLLGLCFLLLIAIGVHGGYVLQQYSTNGTVAIEFGYTGAIEQTTTLFNTTDAYNLTRIDVSIKKTGTPQNQITAVLYSTTATGVPNAVLAVSNNTIPYTNITTSFQNITFNFTPYALTANTNYTLVMNTSNLSTTNYYFVNKGNANNVSIYRYTGGWSSWYSNSRYDFATFSWVADATNFTITASNNYGETLTSFNATISGTTYTTTNGTIVTPYLTNHTSLINITIRAPSHDNRTYTDYNVSTTPLAAVLNFSYYRLNVTAQSYTGINITSFTISVNSTNYSTTTGSILLNLTKDAVYNVSIDATNYSLDSALVNMTTWTVNHTFILYPDNSLFVTIYDEETSALINTTNVSITFYSNTTSWANLTDTGTFSIANLTAGAYSLRFEATGYAIRNYLITVGDRTTQTLNAYLVNSTEDTIFTVKDQDTNEVISDATMTMYRQINGSWVTVESKYTDITGKAQFYYDTGGSYKFYLSKSDYDDYVFYLNPILFSTYDVYMTKSILINYSQDYDRLSIIYSPQYFDNDKITNFTFIISSPDGELIVYGISLAYPGGSASSTGYNAIGSQLTASVNITGASVYDTVNLSYYYTTTISGRRNFTALLPINVNSTYLNNTFMANRDKTYGLGLFERVLIMTIIIIFVVGIATMVGQPIPGMALGLLVFGYMAYIGFMPLWAIIPSLFAGILFLIWKSGGT